MVGLSRRGSSRCVLAWQGGPGPSGRGLVRHGSVCRGGHGRVRRAEARLGKPVKTCNGKAGLGWVRPVVSRRSGLGWLGTGGAAWPVKARRSGPAKARSVRSRCGWRSSPVKAWLGPVWLAVVAWGCQACQGMAGQGRAVASRRAMVWLGTSCPGGQDKPGPAMAGRCRARQGGLGEPSLGPAWRGLARCGEAVKARSGPVVQACHGRQVKSGPVKATPGGHGQACPGVWRFGEAVKAGRGMARPGMADQGGRGQSRHGWAGQGNAGRSSRSRSGLSRCVEVWRGGRGDARRGLVERGAAVEGWHGKAGGDRARLGGPGLVRQGMAGEAWRSKRGLAW